MKVFTLHNSDCCGGDYISVYDSLEAVIERLKITAHHQHNYDLEDTYKIECQEVVTLQEQQDRTQRVIANSIKRQVISDIKADIEEAKDAVE